jgi:methyl-accepting chemotaxis protein
LVEQAAAAASSLESQADDLKASVYMFRLNVSRDAH